VSIAADLSPYSGRNSFGLGLEALSERLSPALDLFAEVLLEPAFAPDELERERKDTLAALARREDRLGALVFELFAQAQWRTHPYRLPILGNVETVTSFTREDLLAHHARWLRAGNLVLAVRADVDPDSVADAIAHRLAALDPGDFAWSAPADEPAPREVREVELRKDRAQAHLVLGFRGLTLHDPDRFALEVIAQLLAGQGGRPSRAARPPRPRLLGERDEHRGTRAGHLRRLRRDGAGEASMRRRIAIFAERARCSTSAARRRIPIARGAISRWLLGSAASAPPREPRTWRTRATYSGRIAQRRHGTGGSRGRGGSKGTVARRIVDLARMRWRRSARSGQAANDSPSPDRAPRADRALQARRSAAGCAPRASRSTRIRARLICPGRLLVTIGSTGRLAPVFVAAILSAISCPGDLANRVAEVGCGGSKRCRPR
jgi:hypothetical protein